MPVINVSFYHRTQFSFIFFFLHLFFFFTFLHQHTLQYNQRILASPNTPFNAITFTRGHRVYQIGPSSAVFLHLFFSSLVWSPVHVIISYWYHTWRIFVTDWTHTSCLPAFEDRKYLLLFIFFSLLFAFTLINAFVIMRSRYIITWS